MISYTIKYNLAPKQNLKAKQYHLEFYAIDFIDFINFSFPSDVTSDLYYGMPVIVNDRIVIYSPTTDFTSSRGNVEILDKAFTLSKKVDGYVGRYVCNFRYEKLQEIIPKDEYKKFYENNFKATNILKIQLGIKKKSFFYRLGTKPISLVVKLPNIIKSKKKFNKLWLILIIPGITLYLMCAAIVIFFRY